MLEHISKQDIYEKIPTVLSKEEEQELLKILGLKYAHLVGDKSFQLEARADQNKSYVKLVLQSPDQSYYYPMEARMMVRDCDLKPKEAALFLIDYLDFYLDEYLKEDGVWLPIDWSDYTFENIKFQLKSQLINLKQEQAAQKLLEEHK